MKDRRDERMGEERHMRHEARDRMNEREGMEKYVHSSHMEGEYAGLQKRRREEMEDGGMIRDDYAAIANLPQQVMIKPYPKTGPYMPEVLDDTLRGIDEQMDADDSQRRKHFKPHKY